MDLHTNNVRGSKGARKNKTIARKSEDSTDESIQAQGNESRHSQEIETFFGRDSGITKKLRCAAYHTLDSIIKAPVEKIAKVTGLSEPISQQIIGALQRGVELPFLSGEEIAESQAKIFRISTGTKSLDKLLGGGIESQVITEVYGESQSGKTQLAHQLCITTQLPPDQGGVKGAVVFIDTEGTFRIDRLTQIAQRFQLDTDAVCKNLFCVRAYNSTDQEVLLYATEELIRAKPIKLLIMDGLMSHLRYTRRGSSRIMQFIYTLVQYAALYNIAVFVTNQVYEKKRTLFGDPITPMGGTVVQHCCQVQLYLHKAKGNHRIARLVDSPILPVGEATFEITEGGIEDV